MKRWLWLCVAGCQAFEPLDLPEDPSLAGAPVGVQTLTLGGQEVAVWYPAAEASGEADAMVDLGAFLDPAFVTRVPEVDPPSFGYDAIVDAPARSLEAPVPLVVFSHGFGGFHAQSATLTAHLASRGYVVVAANHPGRRITDVVGCLLSPPAGPCDLGPLAGGGDPAPEDLDDVFAALPEGLPEEVAALVDLSTVGMFGHSAGGATTTTYASEHDTIQAALTMAGGGAFTRDFPSLSIGGDCDAIVDDASLRANAATSQGHLTMAATGHLAFSDLCRVDLGGLADQIAERDDANGLVISGLRALATDGCPGAVPDTSLSTCDAEAFMPQARADAILKDLITRFFDETLRGQGAGADPSDFDEVSQTAP